MSYKALYISRDNVDKYSDLNTFEEAEQFLESGECNRTFHAFGVLDDNKSALYLYHEPNLPVNINDYMQTIIDRAKDFIEAIHIDHVEFMR